ncbi:MAG: hypothetical protein LBH76_01375, partial [Propionibacteriaceae bacterium]|nr:hypothetical protein [Propionibacteriaceae bacterium]
IADLLSARSTDEIGFHGLRTRQAGRLRFATFDMLVPGRWTVRRSHDLVEEVEAAVKEALPDIRVTVHIEPREDPRSYGDYEVEVPIPECSPGPAADQPD